MLFDLSLISRDPSPKKFTKIPTILYNYLSKNLGSPMTASMIPTIESLIGTALDV